MKVRWHSGMWFNPLTLSSHELVDVALPGPWLRLGQIHTIKVVVAHQVVFGIARHIDSLYTRSEGRDKKGFTQAIQKIGKVMSCIALYC